MRTNQSLWPKPAKSSPVPNSQYPHCEQKLIVATLTYFVLASVTTRRFARCAQWCPNAKKKVAAEAALNQTVTGLKAADILLTYASQHLPYTATAKNVSYHIEALDQWWGDKRLSDVTAGNCRAYAKTKTPAAARRDLETLRAAINYWHREYGPLPSVPVVILPDAPEPRDKWLTRQEADRLVRAAERTEHLKRFILLDLPTR